MQEKPNVFEHHPKKVIFLLIVTIYIFLDCLLGKLFIPHNPNSFRKQHVYYHHTLRKQQAELSKWGEKTYTVYTNSLGFRDSGNREVAKQSSQYRILAIGDSYTEGIGVNFDDTFIGRLQQLLTDDEILNAGVVSYSPKLYYLKTKYLLEVEGLEFNEIAVFIDISDIQDEILYQQFVSHQLPSMIDVEEIDHVLQQSSLTYHVGSRLYRALSTPKHGYALPGAVTIFSGDMLPDPQFVKQRSMWTVDKKVYQEWGQKGLFLAMDNMEKLITLANQREIAVTIIVYPSFKQIEYKDLNSVQVAAWRDFSHRHGAGFIDLFPLFIDATSSAKDIYKKYFIAGDSHWNEAGHKLVADYLYSLGCFGSSANKEENCGIVVRNQNE